MSRVVGFVEEVKEVKETPKPLEIEVEEKETKPKKKSKQ